MRFLLVLSLLCFKTSLQNTRSDQGYLQTLGKGVERCLCFYPYLIIDSQVCAWPQGPSGSGSRCGTDGLGQYKTHGMPLSVWDGLWRPGGAFFQIGLCCVMSHHHIEGLCIFLFKFWRENSKWSSCQQLVSHKHSL